MSYGFLIDQVGTAKPQTLAALREEKQRLGLTVVSGTPNDRLCCRTDETADGNI
jgi:hypothetical protein